jgi:hypothetical protein
MSQKYLKVYPIFFASGSHAKNGAKERKKSAFQKTSKSEREMEICDTCFFHFRQKLVPTRIFFHVLKRL